MFSKNLLGIGLGMFYTKLALYYNHNDIFMLL